MRVGIVGAGMAGLAAARTVVASGGSAVIFEKSEAPGGRVNTKSLEGYTWDTGATSLAPRGRSLEPVMFEQLSQEGLHAITKPIYVHSGLRVSSGDPVKNRTPRYAYEGGNQNLAVRLAEGLDVRYNQSVEGLEIDAAKRYRILGEEFDRVILTPPTPQTRELLASLGETRPISNTVYRMCLTVMLGYARLLPEVRYFALLDPDQRHPLTWLSLESVKCPDRAPEGCSALLAQLSPEYSRLHWEASDEVVVRDTAAYVARLYGPDWTLPVVSGVKRWRYSQPETTALFDTVNHPHATLLVAGDGVMGGRAEYAYESGVKAALRALRLG